WRGIHLDDLADAGQVQAADVRGRCRPAQGGPGGRDEAVQDEGGLPRAARGGGTAGEPAKNGPMIERVSPSSWAGGPSAITLPPLAPAAGPSSMTQSAVRTISRSCSTTTTELPFPASAVIVVSNPATLLGGSPTDG